MDDVNKSKANNPDYVYMIIPADYACVYARLLVMLSDLGYEMLQDCAAGCKGSNKNIISCWNMFQAACAAHSLNKTKEADTLIKYIKAQISNIYKGSGVSENLGSVTMPIDENGELYAMVTCGSVPTFEVDVETGLLKEVTKRGEVYTETYGLTKDDVQSDK
ncbi:hypothetical protein [uncultured phage cr49_1]|jgi:hypothetical protein|uniref:Uncharacterized protein n=1 Tax=uncultured phage cr49_1 TaxID=2986402 RepID=A0AAE7RXL1_9CAUD|nr:hypothetical protein M1M42_gp39 [uncultured phage cr49_1]QWM89048.1 hypothetical protein [uncultured phage cr49_1]